MRVEVVVESEETPLTLNLHEVEELRAMGHRLASKKTSWRVEEAAGDRSVIQLRPLADGKWGVKVVDAVGIVAIASLQILVQPKIPIVHLIFLFSMSGHFPRLDIQRMRAAPSDSLWTLVAAWFVAAAEQLMRRELMRDYLLVEADLEQPRGWIAPIPTSTAFYAGRVEFHCAFDEFGFDTPLNRVIKAAAREVASNTLLPSDLRRRAVALLTRMNDVGDLMPTDSRVQPERRTAHYMDAWTLGLHILNSTGRTIAHGAERAWSFLVRTPEMVEEGIRAVLGAGLGGERVRKRGLELVGSKLRFSPDLLFDNGRAVGDVKYKLSQGEWDRPDLYQIIAFAEAFNTREGAIFRFRGRETAQCDEVLVGNKRMRILELTWVADEQEAATEVASRLVASTKTWLDGLSYTIE